VAVDPLLASNRYQKKKKKRGGRKIEGREAVGRRVFWDSSMTSNGKKKGEGKREKKKKGKKKKQKRDGSVAGPNLFILPHRSACGQKRKKGKEGERGRKKNRTGQDDSSIRLCEAAQFRAPMGRCERDHLSHHNKKKKGRERGRKKREGKASGAGGAPPLFPP